MTLHRRVRPTSSTIASSLASGFALAASLVATAPCTTAFAAGAPASAPAATAPDAAASTAVIVTAPEGARPRRLEPADGQAQCEAAVGRSIRETRGKVVQGAVTFANDSKAARTDTGQLEVQGTGKYTRTGGAVVGFRFRCLLDETGGEPGVMIHESSTVAPAALPVWQADLSRLSPAACEGAAASSLQSRHPRASGIVFDSATRKLDPAPDAGTALSGSGQLVRSPGMPASVFRYRCVFDASGRVVEAKTTD